MMTEVTLPMYPFRVAELSRLQCRSVTLLYGRTSAPFKRTATLQECLAALMVKPEAQEAHTDLVARKTIVEDAMFAFHGLCKNEPPRVCRRPWVVSYAAISMMSAAA